MITCVTYRNWDQFGSLIRGQFSLRFEGFIERQEYDVKVYEGMEYDQYDTPATAYLIYQSSNGDVLGVNRLNPTQQCCMLKDLWPDMVDDKTLLRDEMVWEGTRYCISKAVSPGLRQQIIHEMAIAYLEFGLEKGIKKIIGMMPTYIYRSVFERPGIEMDYLGRVVVVGRHKVRAVAIPVTEEQLMNVRSKTGIQHKILQHSPSIPERTFPYERAA